MENAVVITSAKRLNYRHNYVALPYDYGRPSYFSRADIREIRKTVFTCLETLNQATGYGNHFSNAPVLVKPNLVGVMRESCYTCGYDIPQTTDPRVFEAVIAFLKDFTDDITIGESGGVTTRAGFIETGYDRIAKHYGISIIPFEEQPLDRYYVPKADVQKEVYLPRIISRVIRGEMRYVSVPKMKTNLYTEVTLGFKNAMGILPTHMRYRNHTWQINKKLTDLLYLFTPDLTVVDGIIGGEGLTPGPIDPVLMDTIVSGTNSVEVDRVVTRMMGFDPDKNELMIEAVKKGFGDPDVKVIGEVKVVKFREAEATLLSDRFVNHWPGVKLFVGHQNSRAPKVHDLTQVTPSMVREIESSCRGGCLATLAMNMEMFLRSKKYDRNLELAIVLGNGVVVDGERYWFDRDGKAYTLENIDNLPVKKFCVGECSKSAAGICDVVADGCGNVAELTLKVIKATGFLVPMLSPQNKGLPLIVASLFKKYFTARRLVRQGNIVDIPPDAFSDDIVPIPVLSEEDQQRDWIFVPMHFSRKEIKENLKQITFLPTG